MTTDSDPTAAALAASRAAYERWQRANDEGEPPAEPLFDPDQPDQLQLEDGGDPPTTYRLECYRCGKIQRTTSTWSRECCGKAMDRGRDD